MVRAEDVHVGQEWLHVADVADATEVAIAFREVLTAEQAHVAAVTE